MAGDILREKRKKLRFRGHGGEVPSTTFAAHGPVTAPSVFSAHGTSVLQSRWDTIAAKMPRPPKPRKFKAARYKRVP